MSLIKNTSIKNNPSYRPTTKVEYNLPKKGSREYNRRKKRFQKMQEKKRRKNSGSVFFFIWW